MTCPVYYVGKCVQYLCVCACVCVSVLNGGSEYWCRDRILMFYIHRLECTVNPHQTFTLLAAKITFFQRDRTSDKRGF